VAADSALDVAFRVARSFEELGIAYLVGGSLASSLHGEPRSTQDIDLVADLRLEHVAAWVERLGDDFYVDRERVAQAIRSRRSFNVIHLETMFKADIFVLEGDPASRREMERRELYEIVEGQRLWVASAEDIVLQKLVWFRLGNEISDRQWRDVLAVLRVRAATLDDGYLRRMAATLEVEDLLVRARREAAPE
jgi:hypothetical protein